MLEILKDLSVILVALSLLDVGLLVLELLLEEVGLFVSDRLHDFSLLLLKVISSSLVNLLTLFKDSKVKLQLLVVELEDGFHVFHTLLKGLHLLFKLNLLVSLSIGVVTPNLF